MLEQVVMAVAPLVAVALAIFLLVRLGFRRR